MSSEYDSKYFDNFVEQEPFYPKEKKPNNQRKVILTLIKDLSFLNYSYKKDLEKNKSGFLLAMEVLEAVKIATSKVDEVFNI